jgi:hypothetical protein
MFDGLNTSPIPLEFSQEMTTTKMLANIQAKVNSIIDFRNNAVADSNAYTDTQKATLDKSISDLQALLNTRINNLPNDVNYMQTLYSTIINYMGNIAKFASFGIDANGYFFADVPDSWDDITFSSDIDGRLILEY